MSSENRSDGAGEGSARGSDADSIASWTSDEEDIIERVPHADPLPRSEDNRIRIFQC